MFTIMKAYLAVTILLFVGFSQVRGQSALEQCVNQLRESLARLGPDFCFDFDQYVKCLIRAQGLQILGVDRERLRQVQRSIQNSLSSLPVQCNFNIVDLVRKVRVEDIRDAAAQNVSETYSQGVTEFDDATNIGECANAYIYHVTNAGAIRCEDFTDYAECVLRTLTAPTLDINDQQLEEYEEDLDVTLELLGIDDECEVDTEDILEDLRPTTTTTMAVPVSTTTTMATITTSTLPTTTPTTTTPTTTEMGTTAVTTTEAPDFETATSQGQCTLTIYRLITYRSLTCADANDYVTCIARVLNLAEKNLSKKVIKSLENRLKRQWSILGIKKCHVDLKEIIEKLSGGASKPATTTPEPVTTTDGKSNECVWDKSDGCANVLDGDYQACSSQCRRGVYITCSNGNRYVRDCPRGWYRSPRGNTIMAKLVFDPATGRCEYSTPTCPRYLDSRRK